MDIAESISAKCIFAAIDSRKEGPYKCPECGKKAWFRDKSRDGKKPCFCARHREDCKMRTAYPTLYKNDNWFRENKKYVNIELVRFKTVKHSSSNSATVNGCDSQKTWEYDKIYNRNPPEDAIPTIGLSTIAHLKAKDTPRIIEVNGVQVLHENFVFDLPNQLSKAAIGEVKIFRGEFSSCPKDVDGNLWINLDNKNPVTGFSILIKKSIAEKVENDLKKVKSPFFVAIYGRLLRAKSSKRYIIISDVANIHIAKYY